MEQRVQPRFGVNYTPSAGWFHHWLDFSLDPIRRDFEVLASLGLDHIRAFAIWPIFQPNRTLIREQALDQLASLVQCAGEFGLDVSVDAIQGHMSSFDFVPSWAATWHHANLITDPRVVQGQAEYVRAIASRLADLPNFLGTSIGNEFSQFASPVHPSTSPATVEEASSWLDSLLGAAQAGAPLAEHHHSEYDAAFFDPHHPFTPRLAATKGARTTVHSWIFNNTAQLYGGMSEESFWLASYLLELAKAFAEEPNREVWLQEVGAPAPYLSADQGPEFLQQSLHRALGVTDLYAITWWCSHDVNRSLADFPELEYTLGLVDTQNHVKPLGRAYAELITEFREKSRAGLLAAQGSPTGATAAEASAVGVSAGSPEGVTSGVSSGSLAGASPESDRSTSDPAKSNPTNPTSANPNPANPNLSKSTPANPTLAGSSSGQAPTRALVLDLEDESRGLGREICQPGGSFFSAWMTEAREHGRPGVVLASKAGDANYLRQRGIGELVSPDREKELRAR